MELGKLSRDLSSTWLRSGTDIRLAGVGPFDPANQRHPNIIVIDPSLENYSELNNACIASAIDTEHDYRGIPINRLNEGLKSQKFLGRNYELLHMNESHSNGKSSFRLTPTEASQLVNSANKRDPCKRAGSLERDEDHLENTNISNI